MHLIIIRYQSSKWFFIERNKNRIYTPNVLMMTPRDGNATYIRLPVTLLSKRKQNNTSTNTIVRRINKAVVPNPAKLCTPLSPSNNSFDFYKLNAEALGLRFGDILQNVDPKPQSEQRFTTLSS